MKNMINLVKGENQNCGDATLIYQMMLNNCEKVLKLLENVFSLENNVKNNVCDCEVLKNDDTMRSKYNDLNLSYLQNKSAFDQKINVPFISTIQKDGIMEEILLTKEELLIMSLAVSHNNGIINLCNKTDSIRSLMMKGLVKLNDNGLLVVDDTFKLLLKTGNSNGCVAFSELTKNSSNILNIAWGNFDNQ